MSPALYDDDILLWSEKQAELIRKLGQTRRDLPSDLDIENVAEEIKNARPQADRPEYADFPSAHGRTSHHASTAHEAER